MKRIFNIFVLLTLLAIAFSAVGIAPAKAAAGTETVVSNNVFMLGTYAEVGIGPNGTFGTWVDAPSGYYHHGGSNDPHVGFLADYQKDGWSNGTPPYGGDYFVPGTPWEGFGIECTGGSAQNYGGSSASDQIPTTTAMTGDNSGSQMTADWTGTVDSSVCGSTLTIQHHYYMDPSWTYMMVDTTITNTGSSDVTSLSFGRGVDPDNDESWSGGSYVTTNQVVNQPGSIPGASDTKAVVTAFGTVYTDMGLILGTDDARAKATAELETFAIDNSGTLSSPVVGPVTDDVGIQLAWNLGTLTVGSNTKVTYYYGFQPADLGVHTVTFNANGGTGTMANEVSSSPAALTLNAFTRTGYTFAGWNTKADGKGTAYADGATYDFSADITLYAQWNLPMNCGLLQNCSFNNYVGTSTIPQYWKALNFSKTDGKNATNVEEGVASVQIGGNRSLTKTLSQVIYLTGVTGSQFTFNFSFWVMGLNIPTKGTCKGQVLFYQNNPKLGQSTPDILVNTQTIKCPTGTFAFQQMSQTFTVTPLPPPYFHALPPTYKLMVKFTYANRTGTVWFDNASLNLLP